MLMLAGGEKRIRKWAPLILLLVLSVTIPHSWPFCGSVSGAPGWPFGDCTWAGICGPYWFDWCYVETCGVGCGYQIEIDFCSYAYSGCNPTGCWQRCEW